MTPPTLISQVGSNISNLQNCSVFVRVRYSVLLFGFCSAKSRTKNQASAHTGSMKQGKTKNREIKRGNIKTRIFAQNPKNPPKFRQIRLSPTAATTPTKPNPTIKPKSKSAKLRTNVLTVKSPPSIPLFTTKN